MLELTSTWQQRLAAFDDLIVGLSGGIDSMAMLHVLCQYPRLKAKLKIVHVHHGLSPNADNWQTHCATFCAQNNLPFVTERIQLVGSSNLEARAREARYKVFRQYANEPNQVLLLAHHQKDQAETLLLNLLRGAGIEGLSAMPEERPFGQAFLVRPLLNHSKEDIIAYVKHHQIDFIDDETNDIQQFSRNYIRHEVLPLIQDRWPSAVQKLCDAAKHCQQARTLLIQQAHHDCPNLLNKPNVLSITPLLELSQLQMVDVVRVWLQQKGIPTPSLNTLRHIVTDVILAREDANPQMRIGSYHLKRFKQALYLVSDHVLNSNQKIHLSWDSFPKSIEYGPYEISATPNQLGIHFPKRPQLTLRPRIGGETIIYKGHQRKVKKLLQKHSIPPWLRDKIPLIYLNEVLVSIAGILDTDQMTAEGDDADTISYTITVSVKKDIYV